MDEILSREEPELPQAESIREFKDDIRADALQLGAALPEADRGLRCHSQPSDPEMCSLDTDGQSCSSSVTLTTLA